MRLWKVLLAASPLAVLSACATPEALPEARVRTPASSPSNTATTPYSLSGWNPADAVEAFNLQVELCHTLDRESGGSLQAGGAAVFGQCLDGGLQALSERCDLQGRDRHSPRSGSCMPRVRADYRQAMAIVRNTVSAEGPRMAPPLAPVSKPQQKAPTDAEIFQGLVAMSRDNPIAADALAFCAAVGTPYGHPAWRGCLAARGDATFRQGARAIGR